MPTEKIYELSGHKLLVVFDEQLVRLKKPKALQKFLSTDIDIRSEVLANYIKQDYFLFIGKEFEITNDSLIVEIWGHVYASYFAKAMKNLVKLKLVENVADFIINRSDTIDCGEYEVDSNRKFWDILAKFKGIILTFLPKKIK
ncbi:hypothetical protein FA048_01835 [Pedobacter polaris]|uniref:Uncharacterized protein n=1 Tax=Pedobacter polaris TaxID=2571273 RepID=A0A4U1CU79_9SPHI|nr:hypothetical protein [Pedobacter polaris]TKC12384.1 hypothetical protein FA048_01835 [Pedobacter polaris]